MACLFTDEDQAQLRGQVEMQLAQRLRTVCRESDYVARLGGASSA